MCGRSVIICTSHAGARLLEKQHWCVTPAHWLHATHLFKETLRSKAGLQVGSKCLLTVTAAIKSDGLIGSMVTGVDLNHTGQPSCLSAWISVWFGAWCCSFLLMHVVLFEISNCKIEVVCCFPHFIFFLSFCCHNHFILFIRIYILVNFGSKISLNLTASITLLPYYYIVLFVVFGF